MEVFFLDSKEQEKKELFDNQVNIDSNINKIITGDIEITLHIKKQKNPAELLEKFYLLRNDANLSNHEKNEKVKKIMTDYMR